MGSIWTGVELTHPAETLGQLSATLHMGVIPTDWQRALTWDPEMQRFIGDKEANYLLTCKFYRGWEAVQASATGS